MAADTHQVFDAAITAHDESSKVIDGVRRHLRGLSEEQDRVAKHGGHAFQSLGGHVNLLRTHFGTLRAGIGEVGHSLTDFLPALAGLGAAGSLVGLFELTERAAEAQAELSHMAQVIGLPTQQLQRLDYVAKLTDTSVEGMQSAMTKLNKAIALGGKQKDTAALFHHLGIQTKDARGHLRDAADLLPELADAFAHTTSPAMRARMAIALFGKAGADMIPMLIQGRAKIADLMAEAGTIGYVKSDADTSALEAYADSMKKMKAAAEGFGDELGAKLAPVLKPIIDDVTAWMVANREWLTTEISGKIHDLTTWLGKVPWKRAIDDVTNFAKGAVSLVGDLGGLPTLLGTIGVVMGMELTAKVYESAKAMKELSFVAGGPLIKALGAGAYALWTTRDAAFALDFALDANPFGVIIAGAALVGVAAYEIWAHWGWLKQRFLGLFDWFSGQNGWVQALIVITLPLIGLPMLIMEQWKGISGFFSGLWDGIKATFDHAMVWLHPIMQEMSHVGDLLAGVFHIPDVANGTAIDPSGALARRTIGLTSNIHPLDLPGPLQVSKQDRVTGLPARPGRAGDDAIPPMLRLAPPPSPASVVSPYAAAAGGAGAGNPVTGKVDVAVRFVDLPGGAQISTKSSGAVSTTVSRSGAAWPDTHLAR